MVDDKFKAEQKKKLLAEQTRLEDELKFIGRPSTSVPGDFEARYENLGDDVDDNAFEFSAYEKNVAIEKDLENLLNKVKAALKEIAEGNYGKCSQGDEIEIERLKVIPWASTCIKHSQ